MAPLLAPAVPSEVFLFAGARLKARAYNAFLQGQFRHTDLRYNESDLNPLLAEAWAGLYILLESPNLAVDLAIARNLRPQL